MGCERPADDSPSSLYAHSPQIPRGGWENLPWRTRAPPAATHPVRTPDHLPLAHPYPALGSPQGRQDSHRWHPAIPRAGPTKDLTGGTPPYPAGAPGIESARPRASHPDRDCHQKAPAPSPPGPEPARPDGHKGFRGPHHPQAGRRTRPSPTSERRPTPIIANKTPLNKKILFSHNRQSST